MRDVALCVFSLCALASGSCIQKQLHVGAAEIQQVLLVALHDTAVVVF